MKKLTQDEVYNANIKTHDFYASKHDFFVSYIRRPKTADYYLSIIDNVLGSVNKSWFDISVLEIGCGTGTFTCKILDKGVTKLTLSDISPEMLSVAEQKAQSEKVVYVLGPVDDLKVNVSEKFDVIFSTSFLHHLYDLEVSIGVIESLLKPGGVYIALHEPITNRKITLIEKIDGYLERVELSIKAISLDRPNLSNLSIFLNFLSKAFRALFKGSKEKSERNNTLEEMHKSEEGMERVDYQLNFPFCLSERFKDHKNIRVDKYSHLVFPELFLFSKPLNHQMVVLKN
jgi:ubiquinone/menaquinone biosynthesis C-methylase UbiE